MKSPSFLLGVFTLFAVVEAAFPAQRTLQVPSQYKTIQAAIDAANSPDTVLVAPGTYFENVDFKGKAITVKSSAGAAMTDPPVITAILKCLHLFPHSIVTDPPHAPT